MSWLDWYAARAFCSASFWLVAPGRTVLEPLSWTVSPVLVPSFSEMPVTTSRSGASCVVAVSVALSACASTGFFVTGSIPFAVTPPVFRAKMSFSMFQDRTSPIPGSVYQTNFRTGRCPVRRGWKWNPSTSTYQTHPVRRQSSRMSCASVMLPCVTWSTTSNVSSTCWRSGPYPASSATVRAMPASVMFCQGRDRLCRWSSDAPPSASTASTTEPFTLVTDTCRGGLEFPGYPNETSMRSPVRTNGDGPKFARSKLSKLTAHLSAPPVCAVPEHSFSI